MARKPKPHSKLKPKAKLQEDSLQGWQQIAAFLGQPVSVAQRWARSGMPVENAAATSTRRETN